MQLDHLINILKNGYSYTTSGENPQFTLVPPNKHMIAAALVITKLHEDNVKLGGMIQQWQQVALKAHANCEKLTDEKVVGTKEENHETSL